MSASPTHALAPAQLIKLARDVGIDARQMTIDGVKDAYMAIRDPEFADQYDAAIYEYLSKFYEF